MKINIIFDTNYLFRKTLGVFAGFGSVNPAEVFASEEDQAAFIRKLNMDMTATLRSLPISSRIIMCLDSSSWRKQVEIEGGGYKSSRKKDEKVDWTIFYNLMDQYCSRLEELGYVYSKVNSAEADDLIYFWTRYLLKQGENSIVITGDADLHQLIGVNENGNWVCVLNNNSKNLSLYTPENFKSLISDKKEVSIFDMANSIDPVNSKLEEFVNSVSNQEVDPKNVALEKIISGDKGDDVPPVWTILKNGKIHGITPKKVEAILETVRNNGWYEMGTNEILSNPDVIEFISGFCLRSLGDVDSADNRLKVSRNIERNKKLVWLDKQVLPKELSMEILAQISEFSHKTSKPTIDREEILKGTIWVKEGYVPKKFNPFSL